MRSAQLVALLIIIAFQTFGVGVLTGGWIFQFLNTGSEDFVSAVALLLVAIAAVGWLVATTVGVMKKNRWAFSSAVVAEILASILGLNAIPENPLVGWILLGPAIVALVILLSRGLGKEISQND